MLGRLRLWLGHQGCGIRREVRRGRGPRQWQERVEQDHKEQESGESPKWTGRSGWWRHLLSYSVDRCGPQRSREVKRSERNNVTAAVWPRACLTEPGGPPHDKGPCSGAILARLALTLTPPPPRATLGPRATWSTADAAPLEPPPDRTGRRGRGPRAGGGMRAVAGANAAGEGATDRVASA